MAANGFGPGRVLILGLQSPLPGISTQVRASVKKMGAGHTLQIFRTPAVGVRTRETMRLAEEAGIDTLVHYVSALHGGAGYFDFVSGFIWMTTCCSSSP